MRGSFARMKDIRAYVDGLPSLLAECMDIVRCHLSLSKVPTAPLDPLGPFHSEDDIPPAIKLAILSLQILTSGEFPQMTPPNRHVQDVVSRSSNGILAWTEWICCNFILPEPQSIFMLKYRSRIHSIMFHTLRTFYRVGLRPQVTARPTLVATFWKIWKAEPSIQHDRDQLNRIAPDSHSLAELFLSQDQSFSYIIGNVGLRTADPTEAGTGTIVRFNHFDYAEVREVLHDTHWVVNHAVQNLKSTAYSNSPQYMSLHSHLAILGIFLDHPPLLELMQTNKTVVVVLNICSHLLRPSLPEANVWMAREAILQASEFLLGMLETGVVASIDALEAGLLVMFFKSERVHWYNGAELGPPGIFQEPVAVITLYEKCLQAVIPLMTVRSAMRLAQKSVKHIHAHNLEQPLLSRPKSTLQQFPSVWETLIDHLAVFNAWYSQFVVEGELYTNKCAYKEHNTLWKKEPQKNKGAVCSGCGIQFYCSVVCQKAHWKSHKKACQWLADRYQKCLDRNPAIYHKPALALSRRDELLRIEFAHMFAGKLGEVEIRQVYWKPPRAMKDDQIIVQVDFSYFPYLITSVGARDVEALETIPGNECLHSKEIGTIPLLFLFPLGYRPRRRLMTSFNASAGRGDALGYFTLI